MNLIGDISSFLLPERFLLSLPTFIIAGYSVPLYMKLLFMRRMDKPIKPGEPCGKHEISCFLLPERCILSLLT